MSFRDLKPLYIELRSGNADKRPWTKFQHTSIIPKTQRLVLAELDFLWYSEGPDGGGGVTGHHGSGRGGTFSA